MRVLALLLVVLSLAPAGVAVAQTAPGQQPAVPGGGGAADPFSPLPPPPQQQPEPVQQRDPNAPAFGSETLFIILAGVLLALVGLGFFITRDARRAAPVTTGRGARPGTPDLVPDAMGERRVKQKDKKQRQKAKAARAARKRTTRHR